MSYMMWIEQDRIKPKNNIVVTQAWASKDLQRLPTKFRSFKVILKYLKLYCQYSSLNSFKHLVDSQKSLFERVVWVIINCIIISGLIYMFYVSYKEYITSPILTSMDSDSYPTTELDFPGIAICSVNRISRQSAMEMATNIFNANITDLPINEILSLISQLGNHYSSDFGMDMDRNIEVDRLLTSYYNGPYDITGIMKTLSPQCSMILIKCKLHGKVDNCSRLFEVRKTQDGYCCTFNYARESDDISITEKIYQFDKPVIKVNDLGIESGLTVVMDPLLDDYFYSILPVIGWKVIIFNPQDYPDVASGGVTEVLAIPRSETYIDITPTVFFSTKIIENFPRGKRNCVFSNEIRTMFSDTSYTYSDCIVDCKMNDMQKICGCRPFYFPRRSKQANLWRVCTNTDLECLKKYKNKWWTVIPHDINEDSVLNKSWALHCYNCYPVCEDITYDVLSSKSYMTSGIYKTNLLDFNVTDQSLLHVFFSKYGAIKLKQDVSSYWYELLSNIGGICGVFIGCSLISAVEILYFIALMLRDSLNKKSPVEDVDDDDDHDDKIQSVPCESIQTIYWSELVPRSWQSAKYGQFPKNRARD